jgi:hypothetical protein
MPDVEGNIPLKQKYYLLELAVKERKSPTQPLHPKSSFSAAFFDLSRTCRRPARRR